MTAMRSSVLYPFWYLPNNAFRTHAVQQQHGALVGQLEASCLRELPVPAVELLETPR